MIGVSESFEITGALVHTRPENLQSLVQQLGQMRGVEIHAQTAQGKLVITIEAPECGKSPPDTLADIAGLSGVLSTSLVYQYADPND